MHWTPPLRQMCAFVFTRQATVGVTDNVLLKRPNTRSSAGLWLLQHRLVPHCQPAATGGAALAPQRPLAQQASRWKNTIKDKERRSHLECVRTFFCDLYIGLLLPVKPGHAVMSQRSDCWVSEQEGPPSVSLQRRVLVLWPRPQETEQGLQGLQGSYTGQESLVHVRVPFSHTLQSQRRREKKQKVDLINSKSTKQQQSMQSHSYQVLQSTESSSLGRNSSVPLPDGTPHRHSASGTQTPSCSNWPSGQRHPEQDKNREDHLVYLII